MSKSILATLVLAVAATHAVSAATFSPESPEVRRAVDRAAEFLAATDDPRLGAKALAARVMIYLRRPEHPCVAEAVAAVRRELAGAGADETRIYSLGLAIAMLVELDAEKFRDDLVGLVDKLIELQKEHGGWGYPSRPTGDTSMTQYALYGLWNADRAGVTVDDRVWERGVSWLLRTQDPGGGWGYQGKESASNALAQQDEIRRSMTEAALATLYLGGERFELWKFQDDDPGLAPQLRRVDDVRRPRRPVPFDADRYRTALDNGNRWDRDSDESIYAAFPCYHLYTIERYNTFRNAALKAKDAEAWYDEGVRYLLASQDERGAWTTPEGPVPATGFAALFLLRATRTAIVQPQSIGGGTLIGGRGLPLGPQESATSNGVKPQSTAPSGDLAALAKKLEDPKFLATISTAESQRPVADAPPPSDLRKQLILLAKSESPAAQAAALTALGRTDDFDNVPLLIESLLDERPQVHQAAVDALRFMARRSEVVGRPIPSDEPSRKAEAARWREWYRTIRPPGR